MDLKQKIMDLKQKIASHKIYMMGSETRLYLLRNIIFINGRIISKYFDIPQIILIWSHISPLEPKNINRKITSQS